MFVKCCYVEYTQNIFQLTGISYVCIIVLIYITSTS